MPVRDIRIGACDIYVVRVLQLYRSSLYQPGPFGVRDIDHLQPIFIRYETVSELNGDGARVVERDRTYSFRLQRIVDFDDDKRAFRRYVSVRSGDGDIVRSFESAVRVICSLRVDLGVERALEIVVKRITVEQRRGADHDQT